MGRKKATCTALALIAFAACPAPAMAAAQMCGTAAASLADLYPLVTAPGRSRVLYQDPGILIVEDATSRTVWYFTREGHSAHPAVACRAAAEPARTVAPPLQPVEPPRAVACTAATCRGFTDSLERLTPTFR
jgi:hypothetical protein